MLLAELSIVFVGLAGKHPEVVERQLAPVLEHAGVTELAIPDGQIASIVRHGDAAGDVVRALHVDGVIAGAIVVEHGATQFRLVIYDGEGNLRSLDETPLPKKKLTKDDLDVLAINLEQELGDITKRSKVKPALAPAPAPAVAPPSVKVAPAPVAPPPVKAAPAPVIAPPPAKTATSAPSSALAEVTFDREQPPGFAAAPPAAPAEHHEAAPVETADAVSLDEIEAVTGGGDTPAPTATVTLHDIHLHAGLAFGLAGRSFSPGPSAVSAYSSRPVGSVGFEVGVAPTARTELVAMAERTVQMSSSVVDGMAATTISRWQVGGSIALVHGSIELAPTVGIGHRTFSIDSTDPSRSPDGDYSYVVLGAAIAKPIGEHFALRGMLAFEPVIGGVEPTEMAFGDATRWAIEVGAALELHPVKHVFARAAVGVQRFSWSWDAAGARGAGGASDTYPSTTLSLGAEY